MNVSIWIGTRSGWSETSGGVVLDLAIVALVIISLLIILRELRRLRRELVWWQRVALGFHPRKKRRLV